jgi:hypothetical protein
MKPHVAEACTLQWCLQSVVVVPSLMRVIGAFVLMFDR